MKRFVSFLLCLILFCTCLPALADGAAIKADWMPHEVKEFFSASSFNGWTIGESASILVENTVGGTYFFAVAQKDGHNVLYGFEKPATGTFTEDLEKYRPWDQGPYGGTLLYECGGRRIAVFRDFGSHVLAVTDLATGKDLTQELTDHHQLVRLSPDQPKLMLSPAAFRNTVSIVQGHSALEMSEVRSELEENIENLTSSGDEALSGVFPFRGSTSSLGALPADASSATKTAQSSSPSAIRPIPTTAGLAVSANV